MPKKYPLNEDPDMPIGDSDMDLESIPSERRYVRFIHHDRMVIAREDLRGKHREFCLCYACEFFKPDKPDNCDIAQDVFATCIRHGVTTPIFECPKFASAALTQKQ